MNRVKRFFGGFVTPPGTLIGERATDSGDDPAAVGDRPLLMLGPLGSRSDTLYAWLTDRGVYVRAGCFFGALDKFAAAVTDTHGDGVHAQEYRAAIAMIEAHARLWTHEAAEKAA